MVNVFESIFVTLYSSAVYLRHLLHFTTVYCEVCFAETSWINIAFLYVYSELDYDYLSDHKYEFSVMATDGGSPPLTGSANVQVIADTCFVHL